MFLYLLRHANADTAADTDDARCLSEKGLMQAKKVARFCDAHDARPAHILSSPIRRAHETALIVSAQLRTELTVEPWLASGMHPDAGLAGVRAAREYESLMIVGHEPDFSRFCAHLLGLPREENIIVKKASLTLLEIETFRAGTARLIFSIPCRLM